MSVCVLARSEVKQECQEKQQRANLYEKATEEDKYDAFRANYYAGYVAYKAVALVAGWQAKTAIKSTKTFGKLVDRLDQNGRLTQAQQYFDAVERRTTGPVKRGGYKLGARLGKGSVWLTKTTGQRLLDGAKTAAGQVQLYRHLRQIDDAKLDDLSRRQEARLRTILAHTGADGVEVTNSLDRETVEDLLSLRRACSRSGLGIQRQSGSCSTGDLEAEMGESVVEASDDEAVSTADVDAAIQRIDEMSGVKRTRSMQVVERAGGTGIRTVNHFGRADGLDTRDLNVFLRQTEEIESVSKRDGLTSYETDVVGIDTAVRYADDGESYVERAIRQADDETVNDVFDDYEIDSFDKIDQLNTQQQGSLMGEIAEEIIAPRIARQKGYEVIDVPFDFGPGKEGFDLVARDPTTGKLVIAEVKYRSDWASKTVKKNKDWFDEPENKGDWQMDDDWIEAEIERLQNIEDATDRQETFADNLDDEFGSENVKKEFIAVQNMEKNGFTVGGNLQNLGIRTVEILKLGEVYET